VKPVHHNNSNEYPIQQESKSQQQVNGLASQSSTQCQNPGTSKPYDGDHEEVPPTWQPTSLFIDNASIEEKPTEIPCAQETIQLQHLTANGDNPFLTSIISTPPN
jgi:hypothetical protein